jgi:SAM-dependent methyltransferase
MATLSAPRQARPGKVVEFGCGNGRDARWFAGQGFDYVGLDASPAAVDRCRADMGQSKRCTFQTGDFTAPDLLPAEAGTAELVYSRFTLHSVTGEQEAGAVANAFRLLKPGGRFMLEARSTRDPRCGLGRCVGPNAYVDTHYRRFLDLGATIATCEAAGFEVGVACEEVRAANFLADKAVVVRLVAVKAGAGTLQEAAGGQARQQPEPGQAQHHQHQAPAWGGGVVDRAGPENMSPSRRDG